MTEGRGEGGGGEVISLRGGGGEGEGRTLHFCLNFEVLVVTYGTNTQLTVL